MSVWQFFYLAVPCCGNMSGAGGFMLFGLKIISSQNCVSAKFSNDSHGLGPRFWGFDPVQYLKQKLAWRSMALG